jgi:Carboxypeptidase regulatory-like domain
MTSRCWGAALLACVAIPIAGGAQELVSVEGEVIDRVTRIPVAGVMVRLISSDQTALTDDLGYFSFEGVAPGPTRIEAFHLSYSSFAADVDPLAGVVWTLELDPTPVTLRGLTVQTDRPRSRDPVLDLTEMDVITPEEVEALRDRVGQVVDILRRKGPPRLRLSQQGGGSGTVRYCVESGRPAAGVSVLNSALAGCRPAMILVNGTVVFTPTGDEAADLPVQEILEMNPEEIRSVTFLSPTQAYFRYGQAGQYGALLITVREGR